MPNVYDIALEFRAALLRQDADAAKAMIRSYGLAYAKISKSLQSLLTKIEIARQRKEPVDRNWLLREERYNALLLQIQAEINRFAVIAQQQTAGNQQTAVSLAQDAFAAQMSSLGNDSFIQLPKAAVETMVGFTGDGSPLADLLRPLGQAASQSVREALVNGIALGLSPKKTASAVRDALAGNLTRALAIARTETMRAYREASRQTYQANNDILDGWAWTAKLDPRTCPVCWAMHGQIFPLAEPFGTHVNDRCTMIPYIKGLTEPKETGIEAFAKLSAAEQEQVLGKAKFAAYQAGKLRLQDLVGVRQHPRWGQSRYERSLADALRGEVSGALPLSATAGPARFTKAYPSAVEARNKLEAIATNHDQKWGVLQAEKERLVELLRGDRRPTQTMEWLKQLGALSKQQAALLQRQAKDLRAVLLVDKQDAATFTQDLWRGDTPKRILAEVETFRRLVGKGLVDNKRVRVVFQKKNGRAAQGGEDVYLYKNSRAGVTVHELGHWLENQVPHIKEQIFRFYERRTKGDSFEELRKLTGIQQYEPHEKAKKDKWLSPYMGKWYEKNGQQSDTELLSMGLEYFFTDPLALARSDPEYFDLIYGLLRDNSNR